MKLRERYALWRQGERRRDPALPGSPEGRAQVVLAYPNRYAVGMANLGYQAVWGLLARHPRVHCDRLFLPESEDTEELRARGGALFTLDEERPAGEAHVLAFAVSFESDYLNLLAMLRLAGLDPMRGRRGGSDPVLLAGGIGPTLNPHALVPFFDALFLGEFEPAAEAFGHLCHLLAMGELSKGAFLERLALLPGFLVPGASRAGPVLPQRAEDLAAHPVWSEIVTPHSEFPGRVLIELERGCPFSCRFCAAGYAYGASRRLSLEAAREVVDRAVAAFASEGGPPAFGLIGGALTEYKWIVPLARYIVEEQGAAFSLSSMRLKRIDPELFALLVRSGQRQVTIAPETGSERLRGVVKKNYSDDEVLSSVRLAARAGLKDVKLYSLVGLPTEEDADVEALLDLARRCRKEMVGAARARGARPGKIILSVGPLVPKPGTPFERAEFCDVQTLERRYKMLRSFAKDEPNTELRLEAIRAAYLETFLSRLGEADAPLLLALHERLWNGEGIARALKSLKSEIDARVFASPGGGPLPWADAQGEPLRAQLGREWRAAQAGRMSVAG